MKFDHELTRSRLLLCILHVAWGRILDMRNHPGRWGKFLSCVVTLAWALGFWLNSPAIQSAAIAPTLLGPEHRIYAAWWLSFVALFPIIAVAINSSALRILSTTTLLGTWLTVLVDTLVHWTGYRTALGSAAVAILGCFNADTRLISDLIQKRRKRGP